MNEKDGCGVEERMEWDDDLMHKVLLHKGFIAIWQSVEVKIGIRAIAKITRYEYILLHMLV